MNSKEHEGLLMKFGEQMMTNMDYLPNEEQTMLVAAFAHFCLDGLQKAAFLLIGYAGTGKTSMMGALVKTLSQWNMKTVLLAPTGRAAKVFADYSGHPAFTIHRKIFRQQSYSPESGNFNLAENKHTDTLFIVDEASMIPNQSSEGAVFGSGRLLDDLVKYVYSGKGCKLMLMGDDSQLPPVGLVDSPALKHAMLEAYGLDVYEFFLMRAARQSENSGILKNAIELREAMGEMKLEKPLLHFSGFDDIEPVSGEYLIEKISDSYDHKGIGETIIITRSNKRAAQFNAAVRNQILYREDELVSGDLILVAKNNYFWSEEYEQLDFIANGDVARVSRVHGTESRYGLRFANVTLEFPDHDVEIDAKIVLDALLSDAPALTSAQNEKLYSEVMNELMGDKRSRFKALKKHEYFNALQVKFAYAVTCHKAQGGQWKDVYVDMGYIPEEAMSTLDFYRWLYTSVTRAREHLYLINFPSFLCAETREDN